MSDLTHPLYGNHPRNPVLIGDEVHVKDLVPWRGFVAEVRPSTAYVRQEGGRLIEVEVERLLCIRATDTGLWPLTEPAREEPHPSPHCPMHGSEGSLIGCPCNQWRLEREEPRHGPPSALAAHIKAVS